MRVETLLLEAIPEGPLASAARRALARAHRRKAMAEALVVALTTVRFDAVVEVPGVGWLDCSEPLDDGVDLEMIYAGLRLNAHDRGVVAGFVAELEGAIASTISTLDAGYSLPDLDFGPGPS